MGHLRGRPVSLGASKLPAALLTGGVSYGAGVE